MKLTRVRIDQFQQFRTPLEIASLDAGINLFVGPNESGKSTLVRAIRAAFFERHRSTSLSDLQPWGDSSAAPEITLELDWQGSRWLLEKRFLNRRRCDLQVADRDYSGDEAEGKLAELLGYEFPGRGASKAEHWGIPGLLWVEQGAVQEVREPVGHAGEHLQSALGQSLGDALSEMVSSSGDALIARVELERGQLLTATGRPTGELREAQQTCKAFEDELARLDDQVTQYRDRVDRLGELKRQQQETDASQPWKAQREKARAAEQQLQAVEALQQKQTQEYRELEICLRNKTLYRRQLQDFEAQVRQLEKRQTEKERTRQQLEQCQANSSPVQRLLEEAKTAYGKAEETLEAARQHARRQTLQEEQNRQVKQVEKLTDNVQKARTLRGSVQRLSEQHQACKLDSKTLGKLQEVEAGLGRLAIQQQTLATRLGYTLEEGQLLELGDRRLSGEGEQLLLEQAELTIPGVGKLTIQPGGTDVAELLRDQQRLTADRDALLLQLGVADLVAAEERARAASELEQRIKQERAQLESLAPEGVDELDSHHRLVAQRHDQLAAELAQLPEEEGSADLPGEKQAQASLKSASEQLKAAEQAEVDNHRALSLARQALATAEAEWRSLDDAINAPDYRQRQRQARNALTDLKVEKERLEISLKELQRQIDAANPEVLAQDVERFSRAADAMERHAQAREDEVKRLQISLETLGAQGLEEQRDAQRQELESQQRRRDQLARHSEALDLLLLTRQLNSYAPAYRID